MRAGVWAAGRKDTRDAVLPEQRQHLVELINKPLAPNCSANAHRRFRWVRRRELPSLPTARLRCTRSRRASLGPSALLGRDRVRRLDAAAVFGLRLEPAPQPAVDAVEI